MKKIRNLWHQFWKMFKGKVTEPLLEGDDGEGLKAKKFPDWVETMEAVENEKQAMLRRTIRLNYKKYSLAEDPEKRMTVLNKLTEYEKQHGIDLEMFGADDQNAINEYIHKYKHLLNQRDHTPKPIYVEKHDDYEQGNQVEKYKKMAKEVPDVEQVKRLGDSAPSCKIDNLEQPPQTLRESIVSSPLKVKSSFFDRPQSTITAKKNSVHLRMEKLLKRQVTVDATMVKIQEKESKLMIEKRLEKLKDPVKILEYRLAAKLQVMLERMKDQIRSDPNFAQAACENGHMMERVLPHAGEALTEYACRDCGLQALNQQITGYYKCTHPNCDPKIQHDCCEEKVHTFCESAKDYLTCEACAWAKRGKLELLMQPWFHHHQIRRHSIRYRTLWGCCVESPEFKRRAALVGIDDIQCESEIGKKVCDKWQLNQGYGCTECNWHICIRCLVKMVQRPEPSQQQILLLQMREGILTKVKEANSEDKDMMKKLLHFNTTHCRTLEEECDAIKGKKPEEVFANFQQDFIRKCLVDEKSNKALKSALKLFSYIPTDEDRVYQLEHLAHVHAYANQFEIVKKEFQIIQRPNSQEFFIIAKTIELSAKKVLKSHAHNLIKTLRIFRAQPYDNKYDQIQSILLEQIPGYTYTDNKVRFNQISVLEFDYKIYFWRRMKNPNRDNQWEMQLWKYNIQTNKLEQVVYEQVFKDGRMCDLVDEFTVVCPKDEDENHHGHHHGERGHHGEGDQKGAGGVLSMAQGLIRGVTDVAGKFAKATKNLMQKEAKMNGSGQMHFMFAGQIGLEPANLKFDWTPEEKAYNQKQFNDLEQNEQLKNDPKKLQEQKKALTIKIAKRRDDMRERMFLKEQFLLKQYYFPEKSEEQVQLEKIEREERAKKRQAEKELKEKNAEEADDKEDDANNEDEDDEALDEVKQQVWMISSMRDVNNNMAVVKNDRSKIPVVQFFMKREHSFKGLYSEQEMAKRELRGEIQEMINYTIFDLIVKDHYWYYYKFEVLENGPMPAQIKHFDEYQSRQCYTDWLQTPDEVQWMDVDLPAFKQRVYFIPYIEANNFGQKVFKVDLVHPSIFDYQEQIINFIEHKLRVTNMLESGGIQVVQRTNIRQEISENKTKVMIKNLNLPFLQTLFSNVRDRSYVESLSDYSHVLFQDTQSQIRMGLLVNTFFSLMFINQVQDGSDIEVITCHKDYSYTLMGKPDKDKFGLNELNFNINVKQMSADEKLLKKQLLNRDQQDILKTLVNDVREQTIFINSEYKRMMYTFNQVKFTLTEDEAKDKELIKMDGDDDVVIESDYDSDEDSDYYDSEDSSEVGEEEVVKKKLEWPHSHLSRDFCEMLPKQVDDGFIYIEDRRPDSEYKGRIKKVQILPLESENGENIKKKPTVAAIYYQSEEYYVFLFWYDQRHWFFVRKKITEIFELNQDQDIKDQSLVNDKTKVLWLNGMHSVEPIRFRELKAKDPWLTDDINADEKYTLLCTVEKIVDMSEKQDFVPFITIKVLKKDFDKHQSFEKCNPRQVMFNVLSVLQKQVMCSVPCTTPEKLILDLDVVNIKVCKSSCLEMNIKSLPVQNQTNTFYIDRQQQCSYIVGFFFSRQSQRFIFKEIQVNSSVQITRAGRLIKKNHSDNYHCYQIGQRSLISNHHEYNEFQISNYSLIPFFDEQKGHIIGTQLLLQNTVADPKKEASKMRSQIITMLDSPNYNNIYQYESSIVKFGYQKFYNVTPSAKHFPENSNFYLLHSSHVKQRTVLKCNLDSCEILLILQQVLDTIRHQVEFRFEKIILTNYEYMMQYQFFHQQEMFLGQSMVGLHINDLYAIKRASTQNDIFSSQGTLIYETVQPNEERFKKFVREGIIRQQLRIVNNDFNMNCEIQKAFRLNEVLAQKLLIEVALEKNTGDYQHLFMQILGEILTNPEYNQNVDYVLNFFKRKSGFNANITPCNFEKFLYDKVLPIKSDKEVETEEFSNFEDGNMVENTIVKTICQRDTDKCDIEKSVAVEHSYIDFQNLIINQKLMTLRGEAPVENYSKEYFSELMVQESIEFYLQDQIQKFIDYQFEETFKFFLTNLIIYMVFFFLPFLVVLFAYNEPVLTKYALLCCFWTQIYFMTWEVLQIKSMGRTYFKQTQNLFESGQFIMFMAIFFRRYWLPNDLSIPIWEKILFMLVVVQAFLKILFYLKIFSDYGFLVQMIKQSIFDIGGFLSFFVMWILFFTIQYKVLEAEFDLNDYSDLNEFVQLAIISFRNSIGDIQIAGYKKLEDQSNTGEWDAYVVIILIWVYWFMNIGLMCVILMNFLIAVISESYTAVNEGKIKYVYKDKAEMNLECQQLLALIFPKRDLKCVSFTTDKAAWSEEVDPNADIKNSIREFILTHQKEILDQVNLQASETKAMVTQLQQSISQVRGQPQVESSTPQGPSEIQIIAEQNRADVKQLKDQLTAANQSLQDITEEMKKQAEDFAERQKSQSEEVANLKNVITELFREKQQANIDALEKQGQAIAELKANQQAALLTIQGNQEAALNAIKASQEATITAAESAAKSSVHEAAEAAAKLAAERVAVEAARKAAEEVLAGIKSVEKSVEVKKEITENDKVKEKGEEVKVEYEKPVEEAQQKPEETEEKAEEEKEEEKPQGKKGKGKKNKKKGKAQKAEEDKEEEEKGDEEKPEEE